MRVDLFDPDEPDDPSSGHVNVILELHGDAATEVTAGLPTTLTLEARVNEVRVICDIEREIVFVPSGREITSASVSAEKPSPVLYESSQASGDQ